MRNRLNLTFIAGLLAGLLLVSGCQRETGADALELTGKIFVFNYRLSYATYMVTLVRKTPLPDGSTVLATFENPAGGDPLMLEHKIFPKLDKVVLESPDVTCVHKDRSYAVKIEVKGPDRSILQTIETSVTSSLDQSILPARPLVVGPAYDRNPDVFKDGSSVPDLSAKTDCPV